MTRRDTDSHSTTAPAMTMRPDLHATQASHTPGDAGDALRERAMLVLMRRIERLAARHALAIGAAGDADARALRHLRALQDAQSEVYRLRDALSAATRDAEESTARALDVDAELRAEQARFAELQARAHEVGGSLHEALATHLRDNEVWTAQVEHLQAELADRTAEVAQLAAELAGLQREQSQLPTMKKALATVVRVAMARLRPARISRDAGSSGTAA